MKPTYQWNRVILELYKEKTNKIQTERKGEKMKKMITLIICLLLSTFAFSGCVNRTEKSKSEKVSYDYEISGQEDMSNIEIVPENEK